YFLKEDGKTTISTIDPNSGKLSDVSDFGGAPSWSNDGKWIAFAARVAVVNAKDDMSASGSDPRYALFVVSADGKTRRQITTPMTFTSSSGPSTFSEIDTAPCWSKDNKTIVFSRTTYEPDPAGSGSYVRRPGLFTVSFAVLPSGEPSVGTPDRLTSGQDAAAS